MSTNYNQILDEIEQQKLQVAALIDDNGEFIRTQTAQVASAQQAIQQAEQELTALTDQLAGLATLQERTQELQESIIGTHDINLNINVTTTPTVSTVATDGSPASEGGTTSSVIVSSSTSVPGQPMETSPVIGTSRAKSVRHG